MGDEVKVEETQAYATDEEGAAAATGDEEAAAEAAETADPEDE